jgi:hypothetical protein
MREKLQRVPGKLIRPRKNAATSSHLFNRIRERGGTSVPETVLEIFERAKTDVIIICLIFFIFVSPELSMNISVELLLHRRLGYK